MSSTHTVLSVIQNSSANFVESDLGCTMRGYFDHMIILSLKPCEHNKNSEKNIKCHKLYYRYTVNQWETNISKVKITTYTVKIMAWWQHHSWRVGRARPRPLHPRMEPPSNNSRHDCCWKEVPFSDGLWVEGLDIAKGDFCRLLITFSKSLDPDQDIQNVSPDLDPNCLTLW